MFDSVYCSEESHDGFPGPNVPLEHTCHGVRFFHIFEDLEEHNLLFISESVGKRCNEFFDELRVENNYWSMSFGIFDEFVFLFQSAFLEVKEFFVPEFSLCTLKIFY